MKNSIDLEIFYQKFKNATPNIGKLMLAPYEELSFIMADSIVNKKEAVLSGGTGECDGIHGHIFKVLAHNSYNGENELPFLIIKYKKKCLDCRDDLSKQAPIVAEFFNAIRNEVRKELGMKQSTADKTEIHFIH